MLQAISQCPSKLETEHARLLETLKSEDIARLLETLKSVSGLKSAFNVSSKSEVKVLKQTLEMLKKTGNVLSKRKVRPPVAATSRAAQTAARWRNKMPQ